MDKYEELNIKIIKTVKNLIEEFRGKLNFDKTLSPFGEVTEIVGNRVNVKINGEIHSCRIKEEVTVVVGDMVIVKQIDFAKCKYYVDGKLKP